MTKTIMIDDVDVAECEHLYTSNLPIGNDKIKCGLHQGIGKTCNEYPNCYYKQLKRKEQECEEQREEKAKYRSALDEMREDMEQDTTCESRECGCDDYAECLNCIKKTILNKISEVIDEKV